VAPRFEAFFTPCVEVDWRLAREYRGRGYATEAARAAVAHGFAAVGLREIVSFTVPAEDFDHPMLPEGHPQRRHVLYRLSRP